jgi:hypothetical protein
MVSAEAVPGNVATRIAAAVKTVIETASILVATVR